MPSRTGKRSSRKGTQAASRKTGRPSSYRAEFAKQAYSLCLLGATDADLARAFDVSEQTVNAWKSAHPDFLESLKAGKEQADAKVAQSLFRRATGYSHRAVKIFCNAGVVTEAPYIERYPPDTTAAIFWLKNRRPDQWRDRQPEEAPEATDAAHKIRSALDAMDAATGAAA